MGKGPPVDRGWSWVCCVGGFICLFFVTGGLRSVGMLFLEFVEVFNASSSLTSLTMAMLAMGYSVSAPIGTMLGSKFSYRLFVMLGGFLAFLGAFLTAFAPNIYYCVFVLGILTGVGYGFMWSSSFVVIGQYFNKRRSLASGIGAAGGSLGQLLLPQLLVLLLREYSFQGAMMVYSAVALHSVIGGALYRPRSFWPKARPAPVELQEMSNGNREASPEDIAEDEMINNKYDKEIVDNSDEKGECEPMKATEPQQSATSGADQQREQCCGFLGKIFDCMMFKNRLFIIYAAGLAFANGGYINLCMFLPPYAVDRGSSKEQAALCLSIVGISDLVGRLLGGWFADLNLLSRHNILAISLTISGATAIILPLFPIFELLIAFSILLGCIGGIYVSLIAPIAVDFFGMGKLSSAVGLGTLVFGMAIIPVALIGGALRDQTGNFTGSVWLCGGLMIIGGLTFALTPVARSLQIKNTTKKLTETPQEV